VSICSIAPVLEEFVTIFFMVNLNENCNISWLIYCRFLDPLTNGDYPHSMQSLVGKRLPKFTKEQSKLVKGSFDFIGLNYYTAYYAANAPDLNAGHASYLTDSLANLTG